MVCRCGFGFTIFKSVVDAQVTHALHAVVKWVVRK